MRSHGVPTLPDPVATDGHVEFVISTSKDGFNPHSPQILAKAHACQHVLPAGSQLPSAVTSRERRRRRGQAGGGRLVPRSRGPRGRGRWVAVGIVVVVAAGAVSAWRAGVFSPAATSGAGQRGRPRRRRRR